MDQDVVQRMCAKSKMLFGSKWRWRLLCGRHMIDPTELEKRFDTVIDNQLKQIKEQTKDERINNQQLGNVSGRTTTDGTGTTEERTIPGNQGSAGSYDSAGQSQKDSGNEVRSGQANDGSNTTGSSE